MEECALFVSSPIKGIKQETLPTLGELSSPFRTTSVRGDIEPGDPDIAFYIKRQKFDPMEMVKQQLKKFNEFAAQNSIMKKQLECVQDQLTNQKAQLTNQEAQLTNQKAQLTNQEVQLTNQKAQIQEHDFWISDVGTLPTIAYFDIVRMYLKALNGKAKVLVKENDLTTEFDQCSKKDKERAYPCPHYVFLHGMLVSRHPSKENKDKKRICLEDVHRQMTGIAEPVLFDYLEKYSKLKEDRNESGHPVIGGTGKLEKLLTKAEEMLERKLLSVPFDGADLSALLKVSVEYVRSSLAVTMPSEWQVQFGNNRAK